MRVADYIADFLYCHGVDHVFMVSGGGMMYLSDGLLRSKLKTICTHHEQAAAMAAVSYAKYTGNIGACYVTTGCGGTNALTGVLNAWQDSTPCIFISGQVNLGQTVNGFQRQVGVQEANIVDIVRPITKYAHMVSDPKDIKRVMQMAVQEARDLRPGPVWIDVPMDIQRADINESELEGFKKYDFDIPPPKEEIDYIVNNLKGAQRPIIIAGQGMRIAGAIEMFNEFVYQTQIPFVVSRLGIDLSPSNNPCYIGRIGNKGDRAGNFAVQNADLVLVLGSRLSISTTGFNFKTFAREAKIIVVDIDEWEHKKKSVKIDRFVFADARQVIEELLKHDFPLYDKWGDLCYSWKNKWKVCLPEYYKQEKINTYAFVDTLSKLFNGTVVSDAGSAFYVTSQAIQLKKGQRYITSGGQAEMGYTLPATVGVAFASGKKVVGITGDGSFQMNIQELQTIKHHNLPIKIFVWNNDGYSSIKETQDKFFNGRRIGTDKTTGVSFPDTKKIADAYGIRYECIEKTSDLESGIKKTLYGDDPLSCDEPVICEVMCDPLQKVQPCVGSWVNEDGSIEVRPLEDMYPFLPREEFLSNMIIKPI